VARAKAKPVESSSPGIYARRIAPWLAKHAAILALTLVGAGSLRIAASYSELSLTADEPAHFACGLELLEKHVYRLETQHPPLGRLMTALPPYLAGARLRGGTSFGEEGIDIIVHSSNPQRTVTLMRLGILPFFWLACLVVFLWSRRIFGAGAAVLATGLFTAVPPVLAHAGLATTDMALAACLGAAFYSLIVWAESPYWKHSLLLGVASAAAATSKFTALAYLPASAVLGLVFYLAAERPAMRDLAAAARARIGPFALAVATGAVGIWACYGFSFAKGLPAPEFFDGIGVLMRHNQEGHPAFLLGEISDRGWWYYFPVALAVKTPIALLLLAALGLWHEWKKCLLPLALALGVLLVAMSGNVDIGVRHILPVYLAFAILAAGAVPRMPRVAAVLLIWVAISSVAHRSDNLAYFNELVRGRPEDVLVDSDLDWSQDVIRLSARLKQLGVTRVALNIYPPLIPLYGLPVCVPVNLAAPTETWTVIRPTDSKYVRWTPAWPGRDPWYEHLPPTERVGALLLYRQ